MRTLIQVDYQGNVTLLTQGIYMTKCQIDVSHYPFDPQRCSLKFASWTTESTRLNMSIGKYQAVLTEFCTEKSNSNSTPGTFPHEQILGMYSDFGVFTLQQFDAKRYDKLDP